MPQKALLAQERYVDEDVWYQGDACERGTEVPSILACDMKLGWCRERRGLRT